MVQTAMTYYRKANNASADRPNPKDLSADQNSDRKIATGNAIIYTPDVEGTKAEADAKRARRAKIVFIILDILFISTSCVKRSAAVGRRQRRGHGEKADVSVEKAGRRSFQTQLVHNWDSDN